jgi:hypothetical protein
VGFGHDTSEYRLFFFITEKCDRIKLMKKGNYFFGEGIFFQIIQVKRELSLGDFFFFFFKCYSLILDSYLSCFKWLT